MNIKVIIETTNDIDYGDYQKVIKECEDLGLKLQTCDDVSGLIIGEVDERLIYKIQRMDNVDEVYKSQKVEANEFHNFR